MKGKPVTIAALLLAWIAPGSAWANTMYITQAKISPRLTEQGLKRFMASHNTSKVQEENDHKQWKFNLGVFLNRAADDVEAHVLFYDVEHGREEFVSEMAVFLSDRDARTFLQPVVLERPMFKPNNRYLAALTIRRRRLAKRNFELIGRPIERTGEVAFSDEEAEDPEEAAIREAARREAEARQAEQTGGTSEIEERDQLAQEVAAYEAQSGNEPLPEFDEYGEIPDAAPAPQESGCASCATARSSPRAGPVLSVAALAALLVRRRRTR